MSSAVLSANTLSKCSADTLLALRDRVVEILDFRARQTHLFEVAIPRAAVAPLAPAAAAIASPTSADLPFTHLSPSSVTGFQDCSARWYFRKVLGLPEDRTAALALGSAMHEAIGTNFRQKIDSRADLPAEVVLSLFRGALDEQLEGVKLQGEESAADLQLCGETMARVYMEQAAPFIIPAAVELPVSGLIGSVPVHGFVDVLTTDGTVVDLKTAAKKPGSVSPAHRLQVSTYAMLTPGASGRARRDVLTKTKTVGHLAQTFDVTPADRKYTERLYSITLDQMQTGLVVPNRNSFLCSRRNCSHWERCEADFGGEVSS